MSVYQFLEEIDQEKNSYLSVCVNKSLRRGQDGRLQSISATIFVTIYLH